MTRRRPTILVLVAVVFLFVSAAAAPLGGLASIVTPDLHEWLSYIASDELEGRGTFTAGLGLAAAYIQDHVRSWGARPAGDPGSYLQTVRVLGVKATSRSTVTVEVGGRSRTFTDGDGIVFPKRQGGKRRFVVDRVEFAGYGLDVPAANHLDFQGKDVRGAAVVWLGTLGPKGIEAATYRALFGRRARYPIDQLGAVASIGPESGNAGGRSAASGSANDGRSGPEARPDFTTVQRLDAPLAPTASGSDGFFELLFSRAPVKYAELKRKADEREALPSFHLDGVKLTFNLDADYEVIRTQLTQNVVAIVDGTDPDLRNTYVAFGAHYDHVGYAEGELTTGATGPTRTRAPGFVTPGAEQDRIWNGADDDGSGTVALMALARAFAQGARPKRSLLFVWHTGEERGLYGSRYFVDYPTVPLDAIVAQFNIDMIGRNRDDRPSESNTVYLVGSDRISTELDAISRQANESLPRPMTLDYEFNDPTDVEQLYFRSDHYSYASKGIPVVFFTTGLHPDYHANTDEVSKIEFEKLTRIAQLVYATGERVANLDHAPAHDNRGPRAGRVATEGKK